MHPIVRPSRPYTTQEILDRVREHFIVEGNPRCTRNPNYEGSPCIYGRTGCAVGCLLTEEDAKELDAIGIKGIEIVCIRYQDISSHYFTADQIKTLRELQRAQDSAKSLEGLKAQLQEVINNYTPTT